MNNTVPVIARETSGHRYEAVMRISEAIAACREPEELASTLADEIGDFLHFDHLYLSVFKENSREIEYLVWGKGSLPFPDLPIEELPMWHAMASGIHSILPIGKPRSDFRNSRSGPRKCGSARGSAYR